VWYSKEVRGIKREMKRIERKWRKRKSQELKDKFHCLKIRWQDGIKKARMMYYRNLVLEWKSDPKKLWSLINGPMLHRSPDNGNVLINSPAENLRKSNEFCQFFTSKIQVIVSSIEEESACLEMKNPFLHDVYAPSTSLSKFEMVSLRGLHRVILTLPKKTCCLDVIRTDVMLKCMDAIDGALVQVVNSCIAHGIPELYKQTVITPVLKNAKMDKKALESFRPVSSLPFIAKIVEKLIAVQLTRHFESNTLMDNRQSAYRVNDSTEMALLRIHNDILMAIDKKMVTVLVQIDMSAAFDSIKHDILIKRLSNMGVVDDSLEWLKNYLHQRMQFVKIGTATSAPMALKYGIPQGSILGPLLFNIYVTPMGRLIRQHGIEYMVYADDTQLMLSFPPSDHVKALAQMEGCLKDLRNWLLLNNLKLNNAKTEVIVFGTDQQLSKLPRITINVGGTAINSVKSVRNLGMYLDEHMKMERHVSEICKSANYHLMLLGRTRRFVTDDVAKIMAHSFILAKVDYGNSLLTGVHAKHLKRLQRIINTAAKIVLRKPRLEPSAPLLKNLEWLSVADRIKIKLLAITFKSIKGIAPPYLCNLVSLSPPGTGLRSADRGQLVVRRASTANGQRAFENVAPGLWNAIPDDIKNLTDVGAFMTRLKKHLCDV
jgi:hypothetical protein